MRFNKMRKANEVLRESSVKLFNNITLSAMSAPEVCARIQQYIALAPQSTVRRDFPRLLEKTPVIRALELYPVSNQRLAERAILEMDKQSCLEFFYGIFQSNNIFLQKFWAKAKEFESGVLKGDYRSCGLTLDEIEEEFGHSFWLIRSRAILLAGEGKIDELHAYTDDCKRDLSAGFNYFLVNLFLMLATDPLLHSRVTVASTIRELQVAGLKNWADLLKLLFSPSPNTRVSEELECFELIAKYPVVDQLCMLIPYIANEEAHRVLSVRELSLQSVLKVITCDSPIKSQIVEAYERGNYELAIHEYFKSSDRELIHLSSLAAKAMQISGWDGELPWTGPLQDLLNSLRSIYAMDRSPHECCEKLDAVVLQMHYLPSGEFLQLLKYQAIPGQFTGNERASAAGGLAKRNEGGSPWIQLLASGKDPHLAGVYSTCFSSLPEHRKLKYKIRSSFHAGESGESMSALLSEYAQVSPLLRDYYELASSIYVGVNDLAPLIAICARSIAENEHAYSAFPLATLMKYIEAESACDLDSIVVIYSYVRNIDSSKDYILHEFYEEYLRVNGIARPSDIVLPLEEREKHLLLLRDVSVPETIDFLTTFESSNEVRGERLRILDLLLKERAIDADRHRAEVDETILQAVIDNGAAQFNAHKIFVNDVAIRRKISDEVASLFRVYKASAESDAEKLIPIDAPAGQDQVTAVVAGDKNTTLLKILSVALEAFLYDDKHGLDKNLSVEIRHGFFSNKIRSKLEERHLITEKDDHGKYARNEYWEAVNALLTQEALDDIDECLSWFSAEFNAVIARAESWMKISNDYHDSVRVFRYEIYSDQFEPMRSVAEKISSHEELLEHVIDLLWQQTEVHLEQMRSKIDTDLRHQVDSLFNDLVAKLDHVRGQAAIAELMSAVSRTRNDIREDISAIAEWFRRDDAVSVNARTLQEVVAISIECYNRLRGNQVRPTVESELDDIAIMLDGRQVRSFLVALMNIYENCTRHSGYGTDTPISVTLAGSSQRWTIRVTNPVSEDVFSRLLEGDLTNARERMSGAAYAALVRTEGGSGLRKVSAQFSESGEEIRVSIDATNCDFIVVISNE